MKLPFKKKDKREGTNDWMVTFSDLMTLLLVFFVLLYSFSIIDKMKFQRFVASFQGVGILDQGPEPMDKDKTQDFNIPTEEKCQVDSSAREDNLYKTYTAVKEYIQEHNLSMEVDVRFSERGIVLEIKDDILFSSGEADLKPQAMEILKKLSGLLGSIPNTISVEGHTDNRPIHNVQFDSNWELSSARALAVVRHLSERLELDPKRFCAVGYGEYRPIVPNTTAENLAKNRRVTIVINAEDPYFSGEGAEFNDDNGS